MRWYRMGAVRVAYGLSAALSASMRSSTCGVVSPGPLAAPGLLVLTVGVRGLREATAPAVQIVVGQ